MQQFIEDFKANLIEALKNIAIIIAFPVMVGLMGWLLVLACVVMGMTTMPKVGGENATATAK